MLSEKPESITKACVLSEQIFSKTIKNFDSFSTEKQVAGFIAKEMKALKVRASFPTIVGSAAGGSEPHHKPSLPLVKGFCVIDLGVRVNGFCADITRTVFLGTPSKEDKAIYERVFLAQAAGIKAVKPGQAGQVPYMEACRVLSEYVPNFVHGLGHGLGKQIHIKPFMKKTSLDVLKEGDIVTVEPGVYFKEKFGIRIEDDFLVTKDGCQALTTVSGKLITIPFK